jgi:hypothetical protein
VNDVLTLLATATDGRLERFAGMLGWPTMLERRKQTQFYFADPDGLPMAIEAAIACAVTLQLVHDPGREETYETLHQGPMEGWANRIKV